MAKTIGFEANATSIGYMRMNVHIETRAVCDWAYAGPNKWHCRRLTHAVTVRTDGTIVVLCGRVSELSIADPDARVPVGSEPTCRTCAAKWRKLRCSSGGRGGHD